MERLKELVPVLERFRRRGSIEAVGVIRDRIKLDLNHDQMQTETYLTPSKDHTSRNRSSGQANKHMLTVFRTTLEYTD